MKKTSTNLILSAFLLLLITVSCKDDEQVVVDSHVDNRPPAEVVATLTENLKTADSLSAFTDALKAITLDKEDVTQGLTIFAPLNDGATNNSRVSANSKSASSKQDGAGFTDEELKDHIIKGVLKLADLEDGTQFVSLSGKSYKITRSGDQIWINGVLIFPEEVLSSGTQTVFAVKAPLSNTQPDDEPSAATTSIEIIVWDASQWTPNNQKGVLSAEADVVLYRSQEDYANNEPAYEAKTTGADGKAIFTDIEPGTYYIEVSQGDLSNIFLKSEAPVNGRYFGMAANGVFQSQAEVDGSAQPGAQVGSIRWLDVNADGTINENDLVSLPYEFVSAADDIARMEIFINVASQELDAFPELTEQEIADLMDNAANEFFVWHLDLAIMDGLLSDDADSPPAGSNLFGIDNFQFDPSTASVTQLWNNAYQNINNLNLIIANNPADAELLAHARVVRAYTYFKLASYFGGVPLHLEYAGLASSQFSSPRVEQPEVVDFVLSELTQVQNLLPEFSQDKSSLSQVSINALLAQVALLKKDYSSVFQYTDAIIQSGYYSLAYNNEPIDNEAIWASDNELLANFVDYFGHATLPYVRLTEIHLMRTEAALHLGHVEEAVNIINELVQRNEGSPFGFPLQLEDLQGFWKGEMPKEGHRFFNLLRWELAAETLNAKGFIPNKHDLLPIPQVIIDNHGHILQNPGY